MSKAKINERRKYDCTCCNDKGFVIDRDGRVIPCPDCNPDGAPHGEEDCDNF